MNTCLGFSISCIAYSAGFGREGKANTVHSMKGVKVMTGFSSRRIANFEIKLFFFENEDGMG